jgi:thiamine pyrophosphate-dependent acetolactate synthase large subunit-like protein
MYSKSSDGMDIIFRFASDYVPTKIVTITNTDSYTVSELIWKYLVEQGITSIFGLPGGFITKMLYKIPETITWHNVGNELTNGFLAQTYGQYTNNVGVLFVTGGPGLFTALSAVKNAVQECNPLLLITGHNKNAMADDFQSSDSLNGLSGTTKYIIRVDDPTIIVKYLNIAYQLAKNLNTGVILSIELSIDLAVPSYFLPYTSMIVDTPSKITQIQNTLKSKIPGNSKLLVVVGKGNYINENIVNDFITRNNLPYVTTWKGRCSMSGGINCGRIGTLGNHSANYAEYHATHILVIGNLAGGMTNASTFYKDKFSSGFFNNTAYIASLSITSDTIDSSSTDSFVVSNIENILDGLVLQTTDTWRNQLITANSMLYVPLARISKLEAYCYAASQVYDLCSNVIENVSVTTGVGNHWYAIGKYFDIVPFNKWDSPVMWASIGIGVANGYGMYLAQQKPIWVFEGDGGAIFSSNMILYLISKQQAGENIPMTINIFIDTYYSAVVAGYTMNGYIPDSNVDISYNYMNTNRVPSINWAQIIPANMLHVFNNVVDYQTYLSANPIAPTLRFILLTIDNYSDSSIYEINYNSTYTNALSSSDYTTILGSILTLKSGTH